MTEFRVPSLGENTTEAEVLKVLVSPGDEIEANQSVMELESDKAAFELPCSIAGKVKEVRASVGDKLAVGDVALVLEAAGDQHDEANREAKSEAEHEPETGEPDQPEDEERVSEDEERVDAEGELEAKDEADKGRETAEGEADRADRDGAQDRSGAADGETADRVSDQEQKQQEQKQQEQKQQEQKQQEQKQESPTQPIAAAPSTRRLAREIGVDLRRVAGSGAGGRILEEDVKAEARAARERSGGPAEQDGSLPDLSRWGPIERQSLSARRRSAARRLSHAWRTIPHVTQHEIADITELERARRAYSAEEETRRGPLTLTVLALRAVVAALKAFPQFNASFDAQRDELVLRQYCHIGVAVDTDEGLLVPVLQDADRKRLAELAAELADLADRARDGKLKREEMEGGCFTVSNLGGIGGTSFTPIINPPQVAILGLSRAREQGDPPRLQLPLSLSYDHRVIDGAVGLRFLSFIADALRSPAGLLFGS